MLLKRTVATLFAVLGAFALMASAAWAQTASRVYTIGKYPVEATGTNAVAAKRDAIAQGRKSAFRSLLKRLVPGGSYNLIEHLKKIDPEQFVGSLRVRSEENSSTQYIATLDFSFEPDAVRGLLSQHGVPYVDQPAPVTSLLLLYKAPEGSGDAAMAAARGGASWRSVWADLDLANSITPLNIQRRPGTLSGDVEQALLAADPESIAAIAALYRTSQLVVAEARPVPASNELQITLAGQDASGRFSVRTRYRLDNEDFAYSLELAAVIAQGVIENRWKSQATGGATAGGGAAGGALKPLTVLAEFSNLGHWQRQQQVLARTPGVRNMQVGSLSGRSASIALSYPGGGEALQAALAGQGLTLENINGFWILR